VLRLLPERPPGFLPFSAALAVARQAGAQPAGKQLGLIAASKPVADSPAARALPARPQPLAVLALRAIPSGVALAVALEATAETLRWMVALVGLAVKAVAVAG
jgi:hypothetical protein